MLDKMLQKCYSKKVGGFMTIEDFLKEMEENDKLVAQDKSTDIENMMQFAEFIQTAKVRTKKEGKNEQ